MVQFLLKHGLPFLKKTEVQKEESLKSHTNHTDIRDLRAGCCCMQEIYFPPFSPSLQDFLTVTHLYRIDLLQSSVYLARMSRWLSDPERSLTDQWLAGNSLQSIRVA